jgi:hypothetical protein
MGNHRRWLPDSPTVPTFEYADGPKAGVGAAYAPFLFAEVKVE